MDKDVFDKDVIFAKLKEILVSEFKLDKDSISPGKQLEADLDLDSLDEVEILMSLEEYISDKVDPSLFREARTVQDLVDLLQPFWRQA